MAKEKKIKKDNTLDREEFGYGYDISPDDLGVIGKNDNVKNKNNKTTEDRNDQKRPPTNW
ncbi:hypothetical protein AB1K89_13485 [Sporosarcina sp. 179-K 8C2 HS]|uniref:hypothetical protein n=1 Tax=Sporosarcina sp. 179-K 8C2 HS TaxID=3142387 RepID=UPI00399FCECC